MAPTRPARMTHWSTIPGSTTACSGVSTRVETTVAMELAASWKPLMKSKTSATRMMKTTRVSTRRPAASGHLEDDPLDHVGDVLAPVGDDLHRLVDLLPLDHLDRIALLVEELGKAVAQQGVGEVLQPVDLDGVLVEAGIHRAQAADGAVHGGHGGDDHLSHRATGRGRLLDAVDHEP